MKGGSGLVGFGVVLAVFAGAIWWTLSNGYAAGPWLLAALLLGHAIVHFMFAIPAPAAQEGAPAWPFDPAKSWLVSAGLDRSFVRTMVLVLAAVTALGFAIAALSTVGLIVPGDLWRPAVALSALASAAVLVLAFDPQLVLGLGIDAALLWTVATAAWRP